MSTARPDRLRELLEPVAASVGVELEEATVSPAGRRRLLRVVVDRDDGVDLDAVAEVSRAMSAALDEADVMGTNPYVLEVTTPGVDRPLTHARHWRRARGRLVHVQPADGAQLTGRVIEAGADAAVLDVQGTRRELLYSEVARAVVQVEFNRGRAPGDDADPDAGHPGQDEEA